MTRNLSEGITGYEVRTNTLYGRVTGLSAGSLYIDVDTDSHSVVSLEGKEDVPREYMYATGMLSSLYESAVWEEITGRESISTISILNKAKTDGIEVLMLCGENLATEIEKVNTDEATRQNVINAVNSGKVVTIPVEDVTIGDWSETGYIIMNPETGVGSYMISGGLNGGAIDVIATVTFLAVIFAAIADVAVLLYITLLAIWNLPVITASVSAEICCTTIMMMLLAMHMARAASEDYYAYWESGNEQKIEQMAEKALWLGLVLAAAGAWAYCMDEMNQMGAGGGGTGGGSGEGSGESGSTSNILPNVENATINPDKLTKYALNPEHPVGGNKARVFESALGYNQSNADDLMKQIYGNLPNNEAVLGKLDEYGQRYTVDMLITGPNGNNAKVRTGWIIRFDSEIPELTTVFVKE